MTGSAHFMFKRFIAFIPSHLLRAADSDFLPQPSISRRVASNLYVSSAEDGASRPACRFVDPARPLVLY